MILQDEYFYFWSSVECRTLHITQSIHKVFVLNLKSKIITKMLQNHFLYFSENRCLLLLRLKFLMLKIYNVHPASPCVDFLCCRRTWALHWRESLALNVKMSGRTAVLQTRRMTTWSLSFPWTSGRYDTSAPATDSHQWFVLLKL